MLFRSRICMTVKLLLGKGRDLQDGDTIEGLKEVVTGFAELSV